MDYINLRFGLYINLAPNEKELVEKKEKKKDWEEQTK